MGHGLVYQVQYPVGTRRFGAVRECDRELETDKDRAAKTKGVAIAPFDADPSNPKQLTVALGDTFTILERASSREWRVRRDEKKVITVKTESQSSTSATDHKTKGEDCCGAAKVGPTANNAPAAHHNSCRCRRRRQQQQQQQQIEG